MARLKPGVTWSTANADVARMIPMVARNSRRRRASAPSCSSRRRIGAERAAR